MVTWQHVLALSIGGRAGKRVSGGGEIKLRPSGEAAAVAPPLFCYSCAVLALAYAAASFSANKLDGI